MPVLRLVYVRTVQTTPDTWREVSATVDVPVSFEVAEMFRGKEGRDPERFVTGAVVMPPEDQR